MINTITRLCSKSGPFDVLLCCGDFFGQGKVRKGGEGGGEKGRRGGEGGEKGGRRGEKGGEERKGEVGSWIFFFFFLLFLFLFRFFFFFFFPLSFLFIHLSEFSPFPTGNF